MTRIIYSSLILGLFASILLWPSAKNQATIEELMQKERAWQTQYLGFDLVNKVDSTLRNIQNNMLYLPIAHTPESSLTYSEGATDEEMRQAGIRVSQKPYFQALFALIVLAIGRMLVTGLLSLSLLPFLGAAIVDGLCEREIRYARFKPSSSLQFRVAGVTLFIVIELICLISLIPLWIDPLVILGGILLLAVCIQRLITHYYR